jgi:hypothetical protein
VNVDWGQIINAGAQIANTYAQSRARDRASEATFNQAQDRTAQSGYATDKSLDLEALIRGYQAELDKAKGQLSEYETKLSAPQSRASNAVRGDILANVQDVGVSAPDGVNVTSFSGGLRPSLLSGNSRALGQQMSKEALLDALSGSPTPFSNMAPVDLSSITGRSAPAQTELPQASTMDRVMEAIGTYGGMTSALLNSQRPASGGNQWLEGHGSNVYLTPPEQTRAASLLSR